MEMIGMELNTFDRIYFLASNFRFLNMEKVLSEMFDGIEHSDSTKYLGELNKADALL